MARMGGTITVSLPEVGRAFNVVAEKADGWSQKRRDRFMREWRSLVAHGAELAEFDGKLPHMTARLSDDFRRHCRAYGVRV